MKSLEVLTGYSGFDNLIVAVTEPSDFPDQSNNTKPLHTNPPSPPHPSQSQTNQQTHSGHTSNLSNTNQPILPPISSFEQPLMPSQVPTGMALARPLPHDDPLTLGYLSVKPLGSKGEVILIISDNKHPTNVSVNSAINSSLLFVSLSYYLVLNFQFLIMFL